MNDSDCRARPGYECECCSCAAAARDTDPDVRAPLRAAARLLFDEWVREGAGSGNTVRFYDWAMALL